MCLVDLLRYVWSLFCRYYFGFIMGWLVGCLVGVGLVGLLVSFVVLVVSYVLFRLLVVSLVSLDVGFWRFGLPYCLLRFSYMICFICRYYCLYLGLRIVGFALRCEGLL